MLALSPLFSKPLSENHIDCKETNLKIRILYNFFFYARMLGLYTSCVSTHHFDGYLIWVQSVDNIILRLYMKLFSKSHGCS